MNLNIELLEEALGRLHPAFVHFPIALFLVAGVLELFNLRRSKPSHVALVCLAFGVAGAALAAYSGWERAEHEAPGASLEELLFRHRWCAIGSAGCALLALSAGALARSADGGGRLRVYRGALFLAVGLVSYVGFLGGEMVYGVGYVTEVFKAPTASEAADQPIAAPSELLPSTLVEEPPGMGDMPEGGEDAPIADVPDPGPARIDYTAQVLPIFERACFECHGPTGKSRGGLRLHEREPLFEGDEGFWIILPEDSAGSYLMELINLPPGDPDIMPKDGEPLSPEEIKLLADWIDQGASWE